MINRGELAMAIKLSCGGNGLKISQRFFPQRLEIRGVIQVGYDPLSVPVNKKIGRSGVLLNTPEVAVVQP